MDDSQDGKEKICHINKCLSRLYDGKSEKDTCINTEYCKSYTLFMKSKDSKK